MHACTQSIKTQHSNNSLKSLDWGILLLILRLNLFSDTSSKHLRHKGDIAHLGWLCVKNASVKAQTTDTWESAHTFQLSVCLHPNDVLMHIDISMSVKCLTRRTYWFLIEASLRTEILVWTERAWWSIPRSTHTNCWYLLRHFTSMILSSTQSGLFSMWLRYHTL